jgi:esterase
MLVVGMNSDFVPAEDLAESVRRVPSARVEKVEGAGHSVQSDQPDVLSALIRDFLLT